MNTIKPTQTKNQKSKEEDLSGFWFFFFFLRRFHTFANNIKVIHNLNQQNNSVYGVTKVTYTFLRKWSFYPFLSTLIGQMVRKNWLPFAVGKFKHKLNSNFKLWEEIQNLRNRNGKPRHKILRRTSPIRHHVQLWQGECAACKRFPDVTIISI